VPTEEGGRDGGEEELEVSRDEVKAQKKRRELTAIARHGALLALDIK
jgi:hypothetical protein